jgi:hypothetical protein
MFRQQLFNGKQPREPFVVVRARVIAATAFQGVEVEVLTRPGMRTRTKLQHIWPRCVCLSPPLAAVAEPGRALPQYPLQYEDRFFIKLTGPDRNAVEKRIAEKSYLPDSVIATLFLRY